MSHAAIMDAVDEQTKKRLKELDDTIEHLRKSGAALQNFIEKTKTTGQLMCAKLTREKLRSLTAVAQCQAVMVDLQMLITKNELKLNLLRMKGGEAGPDVAPTPTQNLEWSAPAFAESMKEDNNWLREKLRLVVTQEEQFNAMLQDEGTQRAPPVDLSGLSAENQRVFNELHQELVTLTTVKPEPHFDENSNASADTVILCLRCADGGDRALCPSCSYDAADTTCR